MQASNTKEEAIDAKRNKSISFFLLQICCGQRGYEKNNLNLVEMILCKIGLVKFKCRTLNPFKEALFTKMEVMLFLFSFAYEF